MTKKKIGYLGGTFDPIHFGHLNLAVEALEKLHLDEVWFCPTVLSPHKEKIQPLDISHRLKMVELAIEDCPQFKMIENEAYSSASPYTYDTLKALTKSPQNQDNFFYLLLSEDHLENLHKWHKIKEIINEYSLFIASRVHDKPSSVKGLDGLTLKEIQGKITPVRTLEISSTELKKRLKNKLYCHHLMPGKVLDYIYQNELY